MTIAVLMTAMCMAMTSCSDDDKDEPGKGGGGSENGDDDIAQVDYSQQLPGYWRIQYSREKKTDTWADVTDIKQEIYFGTDGTYKFLINDIDAVVATYVLKGDKVYITWTNGDTQMYKINSMDEREAAMELHNDDSGTPSRYMRYVRIPSTVAEAKNLLKGIWRAHQDNIPSYLDGYYYDYNANGKIYEIEKIKKNAPDGNWYSKYKGQYVGWVLWKSYSFQPDADNPTRGTISWFDANSNGSRRYSDLTGTSYTMDGTKYTHPAEEITYTQLSSPYE